MFQFSYLKDDQNEKVGIGHSEELLQEVEWEECDDVIFGSHYFVGLERGRCGSIFINSMWYNSVKA